MTQKTYSLQLATGRTATVTTSSGFQGAADFAREVYPTDPLISIRLTPPEAAQSLDYFQASFTEHPDLQLIGPDPIILSISFPATDITHALEIAYGELITDYPNHVITKIGVTS